ncbi:MAG: damage-inducible protein DinB [Ferruginibacter sp.]|nr:damage-inducible protein DinB [Ferruginibacter sp.]
MESLFKYVTEQYEAVRASRQVLLEYCETIFETDFINENSSFGRGGSVRNLLVHIANVYEVWIAKNGLNKNISFTDYQTMKNISDIIDLFESVDIFMYEFIKSFQFAGTEQINYEKNGTSNSISRLKLFTHVITHEFHHKGQILSISRHLGYIPVDTDIIR